MTNKVKEGVYGLAITQIELVVPRSLARVASSAEGVEEVLGGVERTWSNFRGMTSAITLEDFARYESLFFCQITKVTSGRLGKLQEIF